jgi:hypothetical protein
VVKIHFIAFLELFMKNIFLPSPNFFAKNQAAHPMKTAKNQASPPTKNCEESCDPLKIFLPSVGIIEQSLFGIGEPPKSFQK